MDILRDSKSDLFKREFEDFFNQNLADMSTVKVSLFMLIWFYRQKDFISPIIVEDQQELLRILQDQDEYRELIEDLTYSLNRMPKNLIHSLLDLIKNRSIWLLEENEFATFFKKLLYSYLHRPGNFVEVGQSDELNQLLLKLGGVRNKTRIYNPFAGIASIASFLSPENTYRGEEINQDIFFFGKLLLMAYRMEHFEYQHINSLYSAEFLPAEYDLIVSHPPFKAKLPKEFKSNISKYYSDYFILSSLEKVTKEGKVVCVLPLSFFMSEPDKKLRKFLVKNNFVEAVIELPKNSLFYSRIQACVMVLQKERTEKKVNFYQLHRFSDIDKLLSDTNEESFIVEEPLTLYGEYDPEQERSKSISILLEDIENNNYSLFPIRYLNDKEFKGVALKEFSTIIPRTYDFRGEEKGKIVKLSHLKNDVFDFDLQTDIIGNEDIPTHRYQKIFQDCLLLSTKFGRLKPTYFRFRGEPIFIDFNIVALSIDEEKVFMQYLIQQLHAPEVTEQIERYSSGTILFSLTRNELQSIKVDVAIPVESQKEIFYDEAQKYIDSKVSQIGLERSRDVQDENSFLRHQIAGDLRSTIKSFEYVKEILREKVLPTAQNLYDFTPKNPIVETTLGMYLEIIERDLKAINKAVILAGDDIKLQNAKIESIDLIRYVKEYIKESLGQENFQNFDVDFEIDQTALKEADVSKIKINADRRFLRTVFQNLIANAERHAFQDSGSVQNRLLIRLNLTRKNNEVQLSFLNNGKKIPENVTLESIVRRGSASGDNAGTGMGIYLVSEYVKLFKGRLAFERFSGNEPIDFVSSFILTFPLNLEE